MDEANTPINGAEITFKWMQIVNAVARGRLAPEVGVARLRGLAEAHPTDRDWLQAEADTIRRQFGLDVAESVRDGGGGYWDKIRSVIGALLDERLDHERALALLEAIDAQHPEHSDHTARLVSGISNSPLRRILNQDP